MLLSIVIPVYNVEAYVERCIRSCAFQDISSSEYEIIAINDGSTDNSLQIIKKLAGEITNLTVYSQKNAGLSAVRNFGFSVSKGDYIWYVDSDDWIAENCLKRIIEQVKGHQLMAMGYIDAYDDDSNNVIVDFKEKSLIKSGLDLQKLLYSGFNTPAQLCIVERELLERKGIRFVEGIYHEDVEYTPRVLHGITDVVVLDEPVYYFYQRPNSITTTVNPKRAFDLAGKINSSLIAFEKTLIDVEEKTVIIDIISENVNKALDMARHFSGQDIRRLVEILKENREAYSLMLNSSIRKYRIEGYMFAHSPRRVITIYNLLQLVNFNRLRKKKTSR